MPASTRIALFLCDTPIPTVRATDGDYTDIFNALLRSSLPSNSVTEFSLEPYDVREKMEYPDSIDDYRAIILTGSGPSIP